SDFRWYILPCMERKRKNANFINGVPELLVLKLLSESQFYGYQLVKEIQQLNPAAFDFGEGCIYPILHNLEKDGLLESAPFEVNGRTRLYYRTTEAGKLRLEELSREWVSTIEGVGRLFGEAFSNAFGPAFDFLNREAAKPAQKRADFAED